MTIRKVLPEVVAHDLEGTLVDLEKLHFLAFEQACRDLGIPLSAREIMEIPGAIGGGDVYIAKQLAMTGNVPEESIRKGKRGAFNALRRGHPVVARPGVLAALEWFRSQGIPLAIGSITPRADAEDLLRKTGIGALIPRERWVLGGDVPNRKPQPDVYIETARRLGVAPSAQLVFEDSVPGVRAAREAGSQVIGMPVLPVPIAQMGLIEAGVIRVFHSWEEVNLPALWQNVRAI